MDELLSGKINLTLETVLAHPLASFRSEDQYWEDYLREPLTGPGVWPHTDYQKLLCKVSLGNFPLRTRLLVRTRPQEGRQYLDLRMETKERLTGAETEIWATAEIPALRRPDYEFPRFVLYQLRKLFFHELCEHFTVEGRREFDPHR